MWIYTPNTAYNTDLYKNIWVDGETPMLRFVPFDGGPEDLVHFDAVASSVRAFDAVMNGLANGNKTLMLLEQQVADSHFNLFVEYDKVNYRTQLKKTGSNLIEDPRKWIMNVTHTTGRVIPMDNPGKKNN